MADYSEKSLGQALLDVPLGDMIKGLGLSIAEAQEAMDRNSIKMAKFLADTKIEGLDKTLLELGFTPTFYQFTEATIDVSMTITMRVSEETKIGAELGVEAGAGRGGAGVPQLGGGRTRGGGSDTETETKKEEKKDDK